MYLFKQLCRRNLHVIFGHVLFVIWFVFKIFGSCHNLISPAHVQLATEVRRRQDGSVVSYTFIIPLLFNSEYLTFKKQVLMPQASAMVLQAMWCHGFHNYCCDSMFSLCFCVLSMSLSESAFLQPYVCVVAVACYRLVILHIYLQSTHLRTLFLFHSVPYRLWQSLF